MKKVDLIKVFNLIGVAWFLIEQKLSEHEVFQFPPSFRVALKHFPFGGEKNFQEF
jgi:hypothetical protein